MSEPIAAVIEREAECIPYTCSQIRITSLPNSMHVCGSTWRKALQTQENMQTPDRKAPDWIWTKEVTVLTTAPAWRPPERSFIDKVSPCELASLNTVKSCTHCVSLGCPRQKTTKNHDDIFSITVKAVQIGQIWWSLQPKFPPCHRVWLCVCRFDAEKGKSSCVGVAKAVLPLCPSAAETTPVEEEERGSK